MNERVSSCGLEGVPLCGNIAMQTACAISFGRRAGFDMNTGHVFTRDLLAAITLVRVGVGGPRAGARCEPGPPLCSVAFTTLLGAALGPKLLEQRSKGWV